MNLANTSSADYLIDTGVLIRLLRGDVRAGRLLDYLADRGSLVTSSIVVLELFRGCRDQAQEDAAESVLRRFAISPPDYDVAVAGARLMRNERTIFSGGQSVPDAIIAATATHIGATLVTLNTRQFSRINVPSLKLALVDQESPDWRNAVT